MAVLTVGKISLTKQAIALVAAAGGGDSFPNTGKEFLAVKNAGSSITLTITPAGGACSYGLAAASHATATTYTIPADSAIYLLGPFPTLEFNDSNGRVQITYSDVTTVTVQVFALPPTA